MTVDANHPLTGEELTFDLELVEIAHSPDRNQHKIRSDS